MARFLFLFGAHLPPFAWGGKAYLAQHGEHRQDLPLMIPHIRSATLDDLDGVMGLVDACIRGMHHAGIDQWDERYPDKAMLEGDLRSETAFLSVSSDAVTGLVVLNEIQEPEYAEVPWTLPGRVAVVHRLMVAPMWEGHGVGRALMRFVEERATGLGYNCIRLDVFSLNARAVRFYECAKYRQAGSVRFRKGIFHCLEKALTPPH